MAQATDSELLELAQQVKDRLQRVAAQRDSLLQALRAQRAENARLRAQLLSAETEARRAAEAATTPAEPAVDTHALRQELDTILAELEGCLADLATPAL